MLSKIRKSLSKGSSAPDDPEFGARKMSEGSLTKCKIRKKSSTSPVSRVRKSSFSTGKDVMQEELSSMLDSLNLKQSEPGSGVSMLSARSLLRKTPDHPKSYVPSSANDELKKKFSELNLPRTEGEEGVQDSSAASLLRKPVIAKKKRLKKKVTPPSKDPQGSDQKLLGLLNENIQIHSKKKARSLSKVSDPALLEARGSGASVLNKAAKGPVRSKRMPREFEGPFPSKAAEILLDRNDSRYSRLRSATLKKTASEEPLPVSPSYAHMSSGHAPDAASSAPRRASLPETSTSHPLHLSPGETAHQMNRLDIKTTFKSPEEDDVTPQLIDVVDSASTEATSDEIAASTSTATSAVGTKGSSPARRISSFTKFLFGDKEEKKEDEKFAPVISAPYPVMSIPRSSHSPALRPLPSSDESVSPTSPCKISSEEAASVSPPTLVLSPPVADVTSPLQKPSFPDVTSTDSVDFDAKGRDSLLSPETRIEVDELPDSGSRVRRKKVEHRVVSKVEPRVVSAPPPPPPASSSSSAPPPPPCPASALPAPPSGEARKASATFVSEEQRRAVLEAGYAALATGVQELARASAESGQYEVSKETTKGHVLQSVPHRPASVDDLALVALDREEIMDSDKRVPVSYESIPSTRRSSLQQDGHYVPASVDDPIRRDSQLSARPRRSFYRKGGVPQGDIAGADFTVSTALDEEMDKLGTVVHLRRGELGETDSEDDADAWSGSAERSIDFNYWSKAGADRLSASGDDVYSDEPKEDERDILLQEDFRKHSYWVENRAWVNGRTVEEELEVLRGERSRVEPFIDNVIAVHFGSVAEKDVAWEVKQVIREHDDLLELYPTHQAFLDEHPRWDSKDHPEYHRKMNHIIIWQKAHEWMLRFEEDSGHFSSPIEKNDQRFEQRLRSLEAFLSRSFTSWGRLSDTNREFETGFRLMGLPSQTAALEKAAFSLLDLIVRYFSMLLRRLHRSRRHDYDKAIRLEQIVAEVKPAISFGVRIQDLLYRCRPSDRILQRIRSCDLPHRAAGSILVSESSLGDSLVSERVTNGPVSNTDVKKSVANGCTWEEALWDGTLSAAIFCVFLHYLEFLEMFHSAGWERRADFRQVFIAEWTFVNGLLPSIPFADGAASLQFCKLTQLLLVDASRVVQSFSLTLDGHSVANSPLPHMTSAIRGLERVDGRLSQALSFASTMIKHLSPVAEYKVSNPSKLIRRLRTTSRKVSFLKVSETPECSNRVYLIAGENSLRGMTSTLLSTLLGASCPQFPDRKGTSEAFILILAVASESWESVFEETKEFFSPSTRLRRSLRLGETEEKSDESAALEEIVLAPELFANASVLPEVGMMKLIAATPAKLPAIRRRFETAAEDAVSLLASPVPNHGMISRALKGIQTDVRVVLSTFISCIGEIKPVSSCKPDSEWDVPSRFEVVRRGLAIYFRTLKYVSSIADKFSSEATERLLHILAAETELLYHRFCSLLEYSTCDEPAFGACAQEGHCDARAEDNRATCSNITGVLHTFNKSLSLGRRATAVLEEIAAPTPSMATDMNRLRAVFGKMAEHWLQWIKQVWESECRRNPPAIQEEGSETSVAVIGEMPLDKVYWFESQCEQSVVFLRDALQAGFVQSNDCAVKQTAVSNNVATDECLPEVIVLDSNEFVSSPPLPAQEITQPGKIAASLAEDVIAIREAVIAQKEILGCPQEAPFPLVAFVPSLSPSMTPAEKRLSKALSMSSGGGGSRQGSRPSSMRLSDSAALPVLRRRASLEDDLELKEELSAVDVAPGPSSDGENAAKGDVARRRSIWQKYLVKGVTLSDSEKLAMVDRDTPFVDPYTEREDSLRKMGVLGRPIDADTGATEGPTPPPAESNTDDPALDHIALAVNLFRERLQRTTFTLVFSSSSVVRESYRDYKRTPELLGRYGVRFDKIDLETDRTLRDQCLCYLRATGGDPKRPLKKLPILFTGEKAVFGYEAIEQEMRTAAPHCMASQAATAEHDTVVSEGRPSSASSNIKQAFRQFELSKADLELKEKVGYGRSGEVFRSLYRGTVVAVKLLFETLDSADADEDFEEVRLLSTLRHPNVVLLMGVVYMEPRLGIVTEYLAGGSLFRVLHMKNKQTGEPMRLDWPQRIRMALDISRGMLFLHSSTPPIVHRDLKSPNLLVDRDWRVKVADFGLSRVKNRTYVSSIHGSAGTPNWTAPEVILNEKYNEKCDVWSFGVVLWELRTRLVPHEGLSIAQIVASVAFRKEQLPLPEATHDWERKLHDLIHACWNLEHDKRPGFAEIYERLQSLMSNN